MKYAQYTTYVLIHTVLSRDNRVANSPTCYNWIIVYELNYVNLNIEQSDGV